MKEAQILGKENTLSRCGYPEKSSRYLRFKILFQKMNPFKSQQTQCQFIKDNAFLSFECNLVTARNIHVYFFTLSWILYQLAFSMLILSQYPKDMWATNKNLTDKVLPRKFTTVTKPSSWDMLNVMMMKNVRTHLT